MLVVAIAYCARQWRDSLRVPGASRIRPLLAPRAVGAVLTVAVVASTDLATTWAVRAGHEGAKATRSPLPAQAVVHEDD